MVNKILKDILENNGSFVTSHSEAYFKPHMAAQHPKVTLVTCCDSRVQPVAIEPDPIDKVFTVETIGNQMVSAQGSVDYGVLHLHTPVLLIMGHTDCGAIKAFMRGYEKENDAIMGELDNLKACLAGSTCKDFEEELMRNIRKNVEYQVSSAVKRYKSLVDEEKLSVIGAVYDFKNALGKGHGRLIITSINGITDADAMKELPQLKGLSLDSCVCA